MNNPGNSATAPQSALFIGNESLLVQCAEIWQRAGHRIAMIVTRNPEIADWAQSHHIAVVHHSENLADLRIDGDFDWLLSVANLQIIPDELLASAKQGAVNFHDGPLPAYAGLNAPVWARMQGEAQHGITWHLISEGVDEGDILVQRQFDIRDSDTALTLNTKCFEAAMDSFPEVVQALENNAQPRTPQNLQERSYYGLKARPDAAGRLDFRKTSAELVALVRALDHGPYLNPLSCPKLSVAGDILLVGGAEATTGQGTAGHVLAVTPKTVIVATRDGAVELTGLTTQTGAEISVDTKVSVGQVLSSVEKPDALNAALGKVAQHDAFWRKWLVDFDPCKLPLLHHTQEQPDWVSLKLDTPSDMSVAAQVAAVGMFVRASGTENTPQLAYVPEGMSKAAGYLSTWVPVGVHVAPDAELAEVIAMAQASCDLLSTKDTFALDIVARDPALNAFDTPDIAVITDPDALPVEGAALNIMATGGALRLRYNRNRLEENHAARLAARLELIAAQVHAGQGCVKGVQCLPDAERHALLSEWNQTDTPVNFDVTIPQLIADQAARSPEATAVVFEHQQLTYAELETRANQTAQVLRDMGVAKGDIVGVHCNRSIDLVVACIAAMKAGAAYLPLDPGFPADRIALYIEDSATKFIVSQSQIAQDLPSSDAHILLLDSDPRIAKAPDQTPSGAAEGHDLAYLIFTSGSTGRPKGVMVEHRNVVNFFAGMDQRISHDPAGTWMAVTSLSFDISVLELFYTLARGFKLVISGDESATQISDGPVGTGNADARGMDFSVYYWGSDDTVGENKYELLLEGAKFADQNGFCAVWTPERHFHAFGGAYPNPSVTGAAVAAVTNNIAVRAGSCVAPLHHTARIAEEWAVVDNLTNGRTGLAIASGWQPDDFVLRPENTPPHNKVAMFEQIRDLRKLWAGEAVEFPRQNGEMHAVVTQPRPVSAAPDIWVTTAGNPETWKDAGRNGAHILTHLLGQSIDEVAEKIKLYHAALTEAGYDPGDYKVTVMLHTFVGQDREAVREMAREPMKDYLRSAAGLIKQYAWAFPAFKKPEGVKNPFELDLGSLSEEELEGILDFAFLRYFEDSGLFGTVDDCTKRVDGLKKIGVTEVACLIDYGIETADVLEGLKSLAKVVQASNGDVSVGENDVSIAGQIIRHNVTHLQCTPSMARMLSMNEEASVALGQVEHLLIGGEALPGSLVRELNGLTQASITNMYGPTETTIWSSTAVATSQDTTVNVGQPIANTTLYVVDDALDPVPLGLPGELLIGGAGVTRGYWTRPDLTAERYIESPFIAGERLYRTGDLVRGRLDGGLDFIGRADHQVKLRGYRIELGEIESRLEELPTIAQAVVIPREDTPGDTRLVSYLRGTADEAAMRAHLAEHLPDYMVPSHFVTLDQFPLTPNKKIDRKALPVPQKRVLRAAPIVASAPVTGVAQQVSKVWSDILGVQSIANSDSFFDLGGHSLLAVQAHRVLREQLGLKALSITDIFRFPTLGALVDRIEKLGGTPATPQSVQPKETAVGAAQPETPVSAQTHARQDAMSKRRAMRARRRERH